MKTINPSILLALIFLVGLIQADAQKDFYSFRFQNYTTRHGLSNNEVNAVVEDRHGFIWAATIEGLNRFDGVSFEKFPLSHPDSLENPIRDIVFMIKMVGREVWAINRLGELYRFDEQKSRPIFTGFKAQSEYQPKNGDNQADFIEDRSGKILWMVGPKNLHKFDLTTGESTNYPIFEGVCVHRGMKQDERGRIWFPTKQGEACFDPKTGIVRKFAAGRQVNSQVYRPPFLWFVGRLDTIFRIDTRTDSLARIPLSAPGVIFPKETWFAEKAAICTSVAGDSVVWLATFGSASFFFNLYTGQLVAHFSEEEHAWLGFKNTIIWEFFSSKNSTVWLSTSDGLVKIDPREQAIFSKEIPFVKKNGLGRIRSVLSNRYKPGYQWVLTNKGGLYDFDPATGKAVQTTFSKIRNLNRLTNMARDDRGFINLNSTDGLYQVAPDGDWRLAKPAFQKNGAVRHFSIAKHDSIWVTNGNELGIISPEKNRFLPVTNTFSQIYCLSKGLNGSVLVSSEEGIFRVRAEGFDAACQCFPAIEKIELPDYAINPENILDDPDFLWVAMSNGLAQLEKTTGKWQVFGKKEGLTNFRIRSILKDPNGHFWLNSDNGLFVFFPENSRFKRFGEEDGLLQNLVTGVLADDGDQFSASYMDSYSWWKPTAKLQKTAKKPLFTAFYALQKCVSRNLDSLENTEFSVRHDENILRFEFTCTDLYQSDRITFEYELVGFDKKTVAGGNMRSAVYTNLSPGKYTLRVWSINADGFRSSAPAVLRFRVMPPFYQTWWFLGLSLAVFGTVLYIIFQNRLQQRLEKEAIRFRIARDLHDEVGSTLSSISILSESPMTSSDSDFGRTRLQGIGQQAREALDSMSDIVWAINPENDSMEKLVARMAAFSGSMLENAGIELHFEVEKGIENGKTSMEQRRDLYLFFKECINNAARHSGAQNVFVFLKKENGLIVLKILDDGRGFDQDNYSSKNSLGGNGLRNLKSRAAALNGLFLIQSSPGNGCSIELRVPFIT